MGLEQTLRRRVLAQRLGLVGGPQTEADERHKKILFWGCFIALVATSFGFIARALTASDWGAEFNLTETQVGEILGAGLWPFAISIVLFSLVIDRIGYPPVYTRELTAVMIRKRQEEFPNLKPLTIHEVEKDDTIKVGGLRVRFFSVYHTIPDSMGIVVESPYGDLVFTGDLRLDHVDGVRGHVDDRQHAVLEVRCAHCGEAEDRVAAHRGERLHLVLVLRSHAFADPVLLHFDRLRRELALARDLPFEAVERVQQADDIDHAPRTRHEDGPLRAGCSDRSGRAHRKAWEIPAKTPRTPDPWR